MASGGDWGESREKPADMDFSGNVLVPLLCLRPNFLRRGEGTSGSSFSRVFSLKLMIRNSDTLPLAVLDLATIPSGGSAVDTFRASVDVARAVEKAGYRRYWFAEHHSIDSIASSAPAVLIAHIASHTDHIRVGAGGVMLPNHSPLVIAEQFGTLEELYPGRIDLGLGRAPGGDRAIYDALRRDPIAAQRFPQDVMELQAFLGDRDPNEAVQAIPGYGTHVPLYILGSSLFGAQLAAALGLPYGFASHFAPDALEQAVEIYRRKFEPSDQLEEPYVIAGLNVYAADSADEAQLLYRDALRRMAASLTKRAGAGDNVPEETLLNSPAGVHARKMLRYTAVGDAETIGDQVEQFRRHADADELIVVTNVIDAETRIRSYEILAGEVAKTHSL